MITTTPGRKILLLSTSSLAKTLSWVRKTSVVSPLVNPPFNVHRVGEKHSDWAGGLHRLPWRTLWPLSWIQHHLFSGDHLLGGNWLLQKCFQQVISFISFKQIECTCNTNRPNHIFSSKSKHFEIKTLKFVLPSAQVIA